MKNEKKAITLGIMAVAAWSTVAVAFKVALDFMSHTQLLLIANITTILVLLAIIIYKRKFLVFKTLSTRDYLQTFTLGMINPFVYYLVLFKAYALLPGSIVQPINFSWALVLAFLSVPLLKQKLKRIDIVAGLIGYLGVVVICSKGQFLNFQIESKLGLFLAILSTVIWALFWILNVKNKIEPVCALFLNFVFSLPFILVATMVTSGLEMPALKGLLAAIYVGLFEMGITFVLWLTALKCTDNSARLGNLIFLAPFVSILLLYFIRGEEIYMSTFIGLGLIIIGTLLPKKIKKS